MKAMILSQLGHLKDNPRPLEMETVPDPEPQPGEVRLRVTACGVCHTELDEIEGRTPPPQLPIILGHQVVGRVDRLGPGATQRKIGERVGVAWIFSACGQCDRCRQGDENLCSQFKATGRDAPGGYAQLMCVPEAFAIPLPDQFSDLAAAPLLCAGAIGYRSLRLAALKNGQPLGLMGFGASAHLVLQMAQGTHPQSEVAVFARNPRERRFARELGAVWAGDIDARAPQPLAAIIDTTPAWKPVVESLANLAPGGRLVINAIRKESGDQSYLQRLDYPGHLWMEKEIKSVANVARRDVSEFVELAATLGLRPEVEVYPLEGANQALGELRQGRIRGAKVLKIED
ncbi:MAG: zinc-dependent alcohol dehydrogenase family protein [Desulfobacterales bacterium]